MVGYGNTSHVIEPQPETEAELVHQTTDTSQSFAFLTASAFNADMQINAFSGRGLVQNYGRLFRGKEFLWLYPHTLAASRNQSGEESVYDTQSWHPDLIVICMGINDFQGELYAEGPVWQKHYSAFVAKLRLHHPGVKFVVCATSVSPRNEFKSNLKSVIVNEHQKGFNDIHYFEFETDHKGLWYHPTVKGHQRVAQKLTAFIADLMNWEIRT
jgi:hypothetical protein